MITGDFSKRKLLLRCAMGRSGSREWPELFQLPPERGDLFAVQYVFCSVCIIICMVLSLMVPDKSWLLLLATFYPMVPSSW